MPLPSGHIVTANEYNVGFYNNGSVACTTLLALTAALQDVAGCTKTFTVVNANAFAICLATFDGSATVSAANNIAVGSLLLDGVLQTGEAHWDDRNSRLTVYQSWTVPLTAGSRTIKLQAKLGQAGGTMQVQSIHTKLTVIIFDLP